MPKLHVEPDGSLTYTPSQQRAKLKQEITFDTDQARVAFLVQFDETPFDQIEFAVYSTDPQHERNWPKAKVRENARLGTYYYRVVAVQMPREASGVPIIRLDAGCPSIIVN